MKYALLFCGMIAALSFAPSAHAQTVDLNTCVEIDDSTVLKKQDRTPFELKFPFQEGAWSVEDLLYKDGKLCDDEGDPMTIERSGWLDSEGTLHKGSSGYSKADLGYYVTARWPALCWDIYGHSRGVSGNDDASILEDLTHYMGKKFVVINKTTGKWAVGVSAESGPAPWAGVVAPSREIYYSDGGLQRWLESNPRVQKMKQVWGSCRTSTPAGFPGRSFGGPEKISNELGLQNNDRVIVGIVNDQKNTPVGGGNCLAIRNSSTGRLQRVLPTSLKPLCQTSRALIGENNESGQSTLAQTCPPANPDETFIDDLVVNYALTGDDTMLTLAQAVGALPDTGDATVEFKADEIKTQAKELGLTLTDDQAKKLASGLNDLQKNKKLDKTSVSALITSLNIQLNGEQLDGLIKKWVSSTAQQAAEDLRRVVANPPTCDNNGNCSCKLLLVTVTNAHWPPASKRDAADPFIADPGFDCNNVGAIPYLTAALNTLFPYLMFFALLTIVFSGVEYMSGAITNVDKKGAAKARIGAVLIAIIMYFLIRLIINLITPDLGIS